jgi:hypothetical protein
MYCIVPYFYVVLCFKCLGINGICIYRQMSFTRFYDDPLRIAKRLDESTGPGRYQLDVPGPGVDMPFESEPHQRLQKWGANLQTNTISLENDLRGLTRPLTRDHIEKNEYKKHAVNTMPMAAYAIANPYVEESRASHPVWMYRDLEQSKWETPLLNPQANLEKTFTHNIQTRLLEKDKATVFAPYPGSM